MKKIKYKGVRLIKIYIWYKFCIHDFCIWDNLGFSQSVFKKSIIYNYTFLKLCQI